MTRTELASKNEALILRALSLTGQKRAADAIGVHESTISRMKAPGEEIETFARLAAALGLKLVAVDEQTYRPDVIQALHTMAKLGFELAPEMAALEVGQEKK